MTSRGLGDSSWSKTDASRLVQSLAGRPLLVGSAPARSLDNGCARGQACVGNVEALAAVTGDEFVKAGTGRREPPLLVVATPARCLHNGRGMELAGVLHIE